MPIYNVEEYIERCARSVFGQTYDNLEFLFVDDCCTDDSINILERVIKDYPHLQKRIRVIHHEKNRGLSVSRDTLVYNSTGEFVYHVDSDDWLEPFAVEKLVRKQRETGADIVMGQWVDYRPNGLVVKAYPIGGDLDARSFLEASLSHVIYVAQWNRLIRRSLYVDNHIFWDENMWREDFTPFYKIYYYAKSSAFVEDVIYNYERRRKSSIAVT